MRNPIFRCAVLLCIVSVSVASVAEARIGGGRSSGSRGFRGFGSRSSYSSGSAARGYQQPSYPSSAQPVQSQRSVFDQSSSAPSRGSFLKGLAGGIAGGFLGSMLFRGIGHAGMGAPGFGGVGIFEILILVVLGYLVYQFLIVRRGSSSGEKKEMTHYERLRSVEPGPYAQAQPQSQPSVSDNLSEDNHASKLTAYDSGFNLVQFKDERMDDFLKLQAAWNERDLARVSEMIGPELRRALDEDIHRLRTQKRMNRIESIAVRGTELVDAWQEYGQEYATLRFRANLVDYTIDEQSGAIVEGDKTQSVKFEEDWTFVRPTGASKSWKLTAIENG
jgi:predicted lipid-binding transport protein (Tim44 family)